MPSTMRLKNLNIYRDRHGKERLYFRKKGGKNTVLRGPIGSPEFMEDYLAASTGAKVEKRKQIRTVGVSEGTMTWLIHQYYQSSDFKTLRETSATPRRRILNRFIKEYGNASFEDMTPRDGRIIRDKIAHTPGSANNLLKCLSAVFSFAVKYNYRQDNPIKGIEKLKPKKEGGHIPWSLEQVRQFEDYYPIGTQPRLALALLYYTGQRRGDIVRIGKQHEKNGWLYFRQEKTGTEMSIPIFPELRTILDQSPLGELTYLVNVNGRPFTPAGFGNSFRNWVKESGIRGVSAHGLRKACAQLLAEDGFSEKEIASIGGWKTLGEVERYTKGASNKLLARNVLERRTRR